MCPKIATVSEAPLLLLVGDHAPTVHAVEGIVRRRGYVPQLPGSIELALETQARSAADVVLLALPLQHARSDEVVRRLRDRDRRSTLVVIGSDEHVRGAPDAFELGADEFVASATREPAQLLAVIGMSLCVRKSDLMLRHLRAKDTAGAQWGSLIGDDPRMVELRGIVRQVCLRTGAGTAAPPILITGETGTGKTLLAKYIHYNGARRNAAFVDINCAAIPESLMESELFGHESGTFTDAGAGRAGLFETADGGTLFLDEVGALPATLQAKLLTAIESKSVRRLGGRSNVQIDTQIVAATLNDLRAMVKKGEFRDDLLHRLKVVTIQIPPLRDRGDDAVLLAETFAKEICARYQLAHRPLSEDARSLITAYAWPGNVRELKNEIERIILLEEGTLIEAWHFNLRHSITPPPPASPTYLSVSEEPVGADGIQIRLPPNGAPLEEIEKAVLEEALNRCDGNVSAAARFLSITRQTMIYRMRKHDLHR